MADNGKTQWQRIISRLLSSDLSGKSPFQPLAGRGFWVMMGSMAGFPLLIPVMCYLTDSFQKSPWAFVTAVGWFVLWIGSMCYGGHLAKKERAALLNASLEVPEEIYLPTYITVFVSESGEIQERAARILSPLLGSLSLDKLACLDDHYWSMLCPRPEETRSGYYSDTNRERKDQVNAAVFSAITRLRRLKSLPYIEAWMQHRNVNRHSKEFVRALQECHETLLNYQAGRQQSTTLLRASAMAETTSDLLLRPVSGTSPSWPETGEQLLRASSKVERGAAK